LARTPTISNSVAAQSSLAKQPPDARLTSSSARVAKLALTARRSSAPTEAHTAAALLGATVEFLELDGDSHLEIRAAHCH